MKKVLVPLAILKLNPNTIAPVHMVRETYLRKLAQYDLMPLFVSATMSREAIEELYAMAGGVLCTGGSDIDPARYGEEAHAKTEALEPGRDEMELTLAKRAIADKKPYLGVCRGCQVLAVASGGSLYQHVPEAFPTEHHGVSEGGTYDELATQERHKVLVEAGSKLEALLGVGSETSINSGHHQSVKEPGAELRVAAKSPAGVVEAIESTDPTYFCFGIQGHPEALQDKDLDKIFEEFAKAVKE